MHIAHNHRNNNIVIFRFICHNIILTVYKIVYITCIRVTIILCELPIYAKIKIKVFIWTVQLWTVEFRTYIISGPHIFFIPFKQICVRPNMYIPDLYIPSLYVDPYIIHDLKIRHLLQ